MSWRDLTDEQRAAIVELLHAGQRRMLVDDTDEDLALVLLPGEAVGDIEIDIATSSDRGAATPAERAELDSWCRRNLRELSDAWTRRHPDIVQHQADLAAAGADAEVMRAAGNEYRLPGSSCPSCRAVINSSAGIPKDQVQAGTVFLCATCGERLCLDAQLLPHVATVDELSALDVQHLAQINSVRQMIRNRAAGRSP